jgi:alkane 1-monooxygenase
MVLFAAATMAPVALLALGLQGGLWSVGGLVCMTLFAALLDRFLPLVAPDAPDGAEFPAAEALLVTLGLGHLAVLPAAVWAAAGDSGLGIGARVALALGAGLWIGQVAVPAAHELIHRGDRARFVLGAAVYASILFGHHASAHRLVHHRHVATRDDPNTARAGEGFWRFFLRAWAGSFRAGLRAERALRGNGGPYAGYLAGSALAAAVAFVLAGPPGVAVWGGIALHAVSQILLSDYVQHYGLTRRLRPDGRPEPVGERHSWNAPHRFTARMMLNAPRHSDHHAHPARPYPALRLPAADRAPRLPHALPVCCVVALVPPLWRRMMAPHLAPWRT